MTQPALDDAVIMKLIDVARLAWGSAMVYKSKIAWGASIVTHDNSYFGGCNIDGIMSDEGICAERAAINHAVVHGHYHFKGLCLFGKEMGFPCGRCLQYALIFCQVNNQDLPIVMAQEDGRYQISTIKQLLPQGYETRVYGDQLRSYQDKPIA